MPKTYEELLGLKKIELHPPRVPIIGETSGGMEDTIVDENIQVQHSKPIIDFNAMAQASEFQRFIYWIRTGKVFRGSNKELEKDLWNTQKDMEMVQELKKIDPNAHNFGNVMNEFKAKVERLKRKRS